MISTSFRGIHFAAHKRITFLARLFRGNPDYASEKSFFFFLDKEAKSSFVSIRNRTLTE